MIITEEQFDLTIERAFTRGMEFQKKNQQAIHLESLPINFDGWLMKLALSSTRPLKWQAQAPDGTMVCAYREQCKRYVMPASEHQAWTEFWKGGDDCASYISVPNP